MSKARRIERRQATQAAQAQSLAANPHSHAEDVPSTIEGPSHDASKLDVGSCGAKPTFVETPQKKRITITLELSELSLARLQVAYIIDNGCPPRTIADVAELASSLFPFALDDWERSRLVAQSCERFRHTTNPEPPSEQ